jgi:inosose dehydratase
MKIGINPLPWVMDSDFNFHLDTPTLAAAFEELKAAGFTAVQADVPEGMDAAAYGAFLDEFGLRPAPSISPTIWRKPSKPQSNTRQSKHNWD